MRQVELAMSFQEVKGKHKAFVFIDVVPGKDKKVLEELMKFDEVKEAHLIAGQYDILAVLEFELYGKAIFEPAQEKISQFIIGKIRKMQDVRDTNTIYSVYSLAKVGA
ncbi:MAG: Lrp/AsnC ligand binding domain-containing protein [Candidatus Brockarchaeota archaeon]|nr:Lrp/AsnC ligand binding domain-containing protein [Candidatus Brockarchaeota archaeon]